MMLLLLVVVVCGAGGARRCGVSTRPFFLLFYLKLFEKGSEKKQKQQRERENETSEGRKKTIARLVVEKKMTVCKWKKGEGEKCADYL